MNRFNRDDDNFEMITGLDGKPTKVLRDRGRVRISMTMRDAAMAKSGTGSVRGEVAGDICTIDGSEGRLRNVNGALQCVPLKSQDARPQFTDGRTTDPTALNRPGFRVPVVNDRRAVHDAYARYQTGLVNAYRVGDGEMQCPECFGSGEDEDGDCDACNGTGIMAASKGGKGFGSSNEGGYDTPDPASDAQTIRDHRQNMASLHAQLDAELTTAWRKG
jgi:hypothetical protein